MNTYKIIKEYVVEACSEEQAEWAVIRGEVAAKVTVTPIYDKYVENEYTPFFRKVIKLRFKALDKGKIETVGVRYLLQDVHFEISKFNKKNNTNLGPIEYSLIDMFNNYCIYNPDGMVASWREDVVDIGSK